MLSEEEHREWERLCEEGGKARDAWCEAFAIVNQKLTSARKPTKEETATFDEACARWAEEEARLREFIKRHS